MHACKSSSMHKKAWICLCRCQFNFNLSSDKLSTNFLKKSKMSRHFPPPLIFILVSISAIGAVSPIASICSVVWTTPSTAHSMFEDLLNNYKKDVRPVNESLEGDAATGVIPTHVEINYFVSNIEFIDEPNGAFRMQLIFRQKWIDPRLTYENTPQYTNMCSGNRPSTLRLPDAMIDQIWTPDLYIIQEQDSKRHELFHADRLVKVSPNGGILFSERISLTLSCPQLAKLDLTKRECDMYVESYGYLQDEMVIEWKEENPIFILKDLWTPRHYKLQKVTPLRCDTKTSTGTYSCINSRFSFVKG